ncbi:MAG: glycosyltransferase family 4 protein [Salinivirgaceae bacterium]|nr:glycosyltransferase family 4 protein [Salinivirgaceae bacterium]
MNILINSGRIPPFLTTRRKLILDLIHKGHKVILTGYQEGFEEEVEKIGASLIVVPFDRAGFNPIKDMVQVYRYYKIIKKYNIDIVHSYTIKPNVFGSIAAKLSGVKEVYPTLNGVGYAFSGQGLKAKVVRLFASILYFIAFKCSIKIFFHNSDDINLMVNSHLVKRNKCVLTLGSGIDMEYYKEQEMPNSISFLLISRLLRAKGIMEYLKAAKFVKEKYPDVEFNLVGPIDPNPTGIKLSDIQDYLDNDIIKYHGPQDDVRPFIKGSSVLVLPSYREGLPHTILEAMSIGRAILTTSAPGCKETVEDGVNGFLVKLYSSSDLKEKIIEMIENPEKVIEMGKQSVLLAKDRFEVSIVNNIILSTMGLNISN